MKFTKYFYFVSTVLYCLGVVINIANNESDIYQLWFMGVVLAGAYLIEHKKGK